MFHYKETYLLCSTADIVHKLVDYGASLTYGTGEGVCYLLYYLEIVFDYLSHTLYWAIIGLGYVLQVVMTVGSVIVGVGAVVFGALGIYLALVFDPNMLRSIV